MNKAGILFVGFLVGALAGVITGVLVALPKDGKTRKILKNKIKEASKEINDKLGEQIDNLEVKIKNLKDKLDYEAEIIQRTGS